MTRTEWYMTTRTEWYMTIGAIVCVILIVSLTVFVYTSRFNTAAKDYPSPAENAREVCRGHQGVRGIADGEIVICNDGHAGDLYK